MPHPDRTCGSCTLCCLLPDIDTPEFVKPAQQWCKDCIKGKGCGIYADRPPVCREFECLWLQRDILPDDLRPDRVGVMFKVTEDRRGMIAMCDVRRPTAWRNPKVLKVLRSVAQLGEQAFARAGNRAWAIGARGEWEVTADCFKDPNSFRVPAAIQREIGFRGAAQAAMVG